MMGRRDRETRDDLYWLAVLVRPKCGALRLVPADDFIQRADQRCEFKVAFQPNSARNVVERIVGLDAVEHP